MSFQFGSARLLECRTNLRTDLESLLNVKPELFETCSRLVCGISVGFRRVAEHLFDQNRRQEWSSTCDFD